MRSSTIVPFLVRGAIVALAVIVTVAIVLSGPAGFGRSGQSAEAAFLSEVKKLLASDAEAGDRFGYSVAVSGDTAVVGARSEDAGGNDAGAAYIFQRDEGSADNWGELKKLLASDAQPGDSFGFSVTISGDTAVVGAVFEDAGGDDAGAAYLFQRDQGGADSWGEVAMLTASDAQAGDLFGWSVAVSGDSAVVGAFFEDAGGLFAGAAYLFQRDQGGADNWGEVKKLTASDAQGGDEFGSGVAVSGDTAVVGAALEDAGGSEAGAAYVFEEPLPPPTPTPTPTPKPPDGDTDGDTIPNSSDPDDDNDGCTDVAELGTNEISGGQRDPHNFWDFVDQWTGAPLAKNGTVTVGDLGAVVARFGTFQDPILTKEEAQAEALTQPVAAIGYHASADRAGSSGPNPWNLLPPNGTITVGDLGVVVAQFGHFCL